MRDKIKRDKTVMFRVTEREFSIFEEAAKSKQISKSELFRRFIDRLHAEIAPL